MRTIRAWVLFAFVLMGSPALAQERQPNIVFMMVDNYGYGELGVYGGGALRGAETPRLDRLADEGMRLTNFNVEPQCTPSRSALMTGRHPIRSGTTRVVWGVLYGLVQWEKTIAELLSDAGYATGMFGKWHLGDTPGRFPTDQGFDEWYGIPNTTDESVYTSHPQFDPTVSVTPEILTASRGQEPELVGEYDVGGETKDRRRPYRPNDSVHEIERRERNAFFRLRAVHSSARPDLAPSRLRGSIGKRALRRRDDGDRPSSGARSSTRLMNLASETRRL